jgi:hypothetical protein
MLLLNDKVKYKIYTEDKTPPVQLEYMYIAEGEKNETTVQIPDHSLKKTTYQYQYTKQTNNSFG